MLLRNLECLFLLKLSFVLLQIVLGEQLYPTRKEVVDGQGLEDGGVEELLSLGNGSFGLLF